MRALFLPLIMASSSGAGFIPPPANSTTVVDPYLEPDRNVFKQNEIADLTFAFDNTTPDLDVVDRMFFWYGDGGVGLPYRAGSAPTTPPIIERLDGAEFFGVTHRFYAPWTYPGEYTFEVDTIFVTAAGDIGSDQYRYQFSIVPEPTTGFLLIFALLVFLQARVQFGKLAKNLQH